MVFEPRRRGNVKDCSVEDTGPVDLSGSSYGVFFIFWHVPVKVSDLSRFTY